MPFIETAGLIAASVQAAVGVIQLVGNVLTSGRSVIIEVDNNTPVTLTKFADNHDSGGFAALPHLQILPHTAEVFGSQSKGGAVATGTVGSVTYTGDGLAMLVGWNNAFGGDNKTNVGANNTGLGGPNASRFLAIHQTGSGNQNAQMRFMLFVHPPYSLREALTEKGVVLRDPGDLSNKGFRALFPGVLNVRDILPNSTAIDAT
jgi:hypothetical protein